MLRNKKYNFIFFVVLFSSLAFGSQVFAVAGNISSSNYQALLCENAACTTTSSVNFGKFTSNPAYNVTVSGTELTGYIWGENFGWVVLNCSNTTSGCSSTNANFKVANDGSGSLSGYAWGENAGWINFGPFSNNSVTTVSINDQGKFNGYAWAQNYGWIKFDCSSTSSCVETSWRPTGSVGSSSGVRSGSIFSIKKKKESIPVPTIIPTLPDDLPKNPGTGILEDTKGIFQDFLDRPVSGNTGFGIVNDDERVLPDVSGDIPSYTAESTGDTEDMIEEEERLGFWARVKIRFKEFTKNLFHRKEKIESEIEILELE